MAPKSSPTPPPRSPPLSPPRSPPQRPTRHSESSASSSQGRREQLYSPTNPSQLRRSFFSISPTHGQEDSSSSSPSVSVERGKAAADEARAESAVPTGFTFDGDAEANERSSLLSREGSDGEGQGTTTMRRTSGRPGLRRNYNSFTSLMTDAGYGTIAYSNESDVYRNSEDNSSSVTFGDAINDGLNGDENGSKTATGRQGETHRVKGRRRMYVAYYVPILKWIRQYRWIHLRGDLVAAVTLASFYIPMALSLASNLGHIPPINGLYSFVFNPLVYAILGSCPQMVVGPEAAGSLLTGQVVRENIARGDLDDADGQRSAQIAGIVTFTAGLVTFVAGIFRLGFLDNVLSRPFLRGFISAIGIVIFVDQLVPEMGLSGMASKVGGVSHGSVVQKLKFLFRYAGDAHKLTTAVSFGTFAVIMVCREVKRRLQKSYPSVAYVPDRFIVVVLSAILSWQLRWDRHGLEILGDIKSQGKTFAVHWPFNFSHLKYASDAFSTSFLIALLGFFESSVAAKSLGNEERKPGAIKNINPSANRELVALGTANMVGGLFMALPAFGGYGRSKVNASTGGRTPMSSIFLSLITLICILFLLPYFYYLPKGVLCSMISVVAWSLLEEIPPDLLFFVRIRGYSELLLMGLIFVTTILWNLNVGMAVGIGLSLLRVIRHSTRPRIQILGRVPGTTGKFENAEREPGRLEFFEGCLIVKIPEPLTFANTGDLKSRLKRLEQYGTGKAHPALPPVRGKEHNKNIIFDVHGVTSLDGAGVQVLMEIVKNYADHDVHVFFCRVPKEGSRVWKLFVTSGIVDVCGGRDHFVGSVEDALRMTESEGSAIIDVERAA